MTSPYNLPPGCLASDIEGEPMPDCEQCGEEFNDLKETGLCDDCTAKQQEAE
jgi:hypothetical protein